MGKCLASQAATRVDSTDKQDLTCQSEIEHSIRAANYYIADIYREQASSARPDRPELLRMIADLQSGEVVVAKKIDRCD